MRKILFIAACLLAGPAQAQMLTGEANENGGAQPTHESIQQKSMSVAAPTPVADNIPLEITADTSLEWQRNEKTFTARGNALAKQGDASVSAATLTAHYVENSTKGGGGGMKISQVFAEDNVVIRSKDTEAFGAKATYDLDKGYAVMTGSDLRMTSPDQTVTAHDKFEYWMKDAKFVAVGRAKISRTGDTLEADTISAVMQDNAQGQRKLESLEANGNVVIVTPSEMVTGAHGVYKASTNTAEMTGGVKITRGPNVLEGERAEVDLNTNTSRIFGAGGQAGRVRAVFYPGSDKKP